MLYITEHNTPVGELAAFFIRNGPYTGFMGHGRSKGCICIQDKGEHQTAASRFLFLKSLKGPSCQIRLAREWYFCKRLGVVINRYYE